MTKQAWRSNAVAAEQAAGGCDNSGQPDTGRNSKQQQRQQQRQQQLQQQQRQQVDGHHKQAAPGAHQQQQLATALLSASKRKAPTAAGATHKTKHKKQQHQSSKRQSGRNSGQETEQLVQAPVAAPIAAAAAAASTWPGAATAAVAASDPKDDEVRRLFRSWAWKREHRPDKDRFHRPYVHTMSVPSSSSNSSNNGSPQEVSLTIKQQKFSSEGFASTVWDSSIVVAKYLEKLGPDVLSGKRCLDLSAGCGLVGVVMAKLGADVTVTDLAPNLPLLQHNCSANGVSDVSVLEHRWGEDVTALRPPFTFIVACDVMYVHELVQPLLQSLTALSDPSTTILVAHGRNRPAETDFKALASADFTVELEPGCELDEVYQCSDVDVLRLRRRQS